VGDIASLRDDDQPIPGDEPSLRDLFFDVHSTFDFGIGYAGGVYLPTTAEKNYDHRYGGDVPRLYPENWVEFYSCSCGDRLVSVDGLAYWCTISGEALIPRGTTEDFIADYFSARVAGTLVPRCER
jgi:hypothetical protein